MNRVTRPSLNSQRKPSGTSSSTPLVLPFAEVADEDHDARALHQLVLDQTQPLPVPLVVREHLAEALAPG